MGKNDFIARQDAKIREAFHKSIEADYYQEKLDDALKAALPNHFYPFSERYPDFKKFDYTKGKWK